MFDSLEGLQAIPWVQEWNALSGFDYFAHGETPGGNPLLVAKFQNGNIMVVGFLDAPLPWIAWVTGNTIESHRTRK